MNNKRALWTIEELKTAVLSADSMAQTLRFLGLETSSGNYRTIKRYLARYEIDVSHWVGNGWVGRRGPDSVPNKIPIEQILVEGSTYPTSKLLKRLIREGLKERKCEGEGCGIVEWLGVPAPLQTDHINGVHDDHRIENLRFLCPNCHAITPTYAGRNKKRRQLNILGYEEDGNPPGLGPG